MTALDLPALRALHAAATPGPWEEHVTPEDVVEGIPAYADIEAPQCPVAAVLDPADAALIVNAVNNLPALLDRLDAAEAALKEARAALHRVSDLADEYQWTIREYDVQIITRQRAADSIRRALKGDAP